MSTREQVPRVRMGIMVPSDIRLWLKRKAAELDTTMNDLIIVALEKHIEESDRLKAQS